MLATPKSMRQKWRRWLIRIETDIRDLLIAESIYDGIGKIVESNPDIQHPGDVHAWIQRNYGTAAVVGIRRLTDNRNDSISLTRLLSDIAKHSDSITRSSHVSCYRFCPRDAGEKWFDNFAGRGQITLPSKVPRSHLRELTKVAKRIRRIVDTRIAHLDQKNVSRKPLKFQDIHDAIEVIDKTTIKYKLLLNAASPQPTLLGTWQYDWESVFYQSWVKSPPQGWGR